MRRLTVREWSRGATSRGTGESEAEEEVELVELFLIIVSMCLDLAPSHT